MNLILPVTVGIVQIIHSENVTNYKKSKLEIVSTRTTQIDETTDIYF